MKRSMLTVISAGVMLMIFACGGGSSPIPGGYEEITDPFQELQDIANQFNSEGKIAAVGQGRSSMQDNALESARTNAQSRIAQTFESKTEVLKKRFIEELGTNMDVELNEAFTNVVKVTSKKVLKGATQFRTKFLRDKKDGSYLAGCIMYISSELLNQSMLNEMQKHPKLYERFRASEAYKELEKEMESYNN